MNTTNEVMTRYLLGQLDDRESQELEESFFCDDEVFDALMVAEGELIEAYVQGELPDEQQSLFENQLDSSPKRRSRVEMARLLVAEAQQNQGATPGSNGGGSSSGSGSGVAGADLPVGKPGRRTLYRALPAAACLLMALLTGWSWQETSTIGQGQIALKEKVDAQEKANADLQRELDTAPSAQPVNISFPPITRSAPSAPVPATISIKSDRDMVVIQVQWLEAKVGSTYRLELTHRATEEQWIRTRMSADESEDADATFRFGVSAQELTPGDYNLALYEEGENPSGKPARQGIIVVTKAIP